MITVRRCLAAAVLVGLPAIASAASGASDSRYCDALIGRFNAYASNMSDWQHTNHPSEATVDRAILDCQAGDTAEGIPPLEKALRDAGIGLPARNI